jgi:hypothetical protein
VDPCSESGSRIRIKGQENQEKMHFLVNFVMFITERYKKIQTSTGIFFIIVFYSSVVAGFKDFVDPDPVGAKMLYPNLD